MSREPVVFRGQTLTRLLGSIQQRLTRLEKQRKSSTPSGLINPYGGTAAPSGWLMCDGTVYSMSTYPTLGALLGSRYGGNGSTTFAVPDMRSRAPIWDSPTGGTVLSLVAATTAHSHTYSDTTDPNGSSHTHGVNITSGARGQSHTHSGVQTGSGTSGQANSQHDHPVVGDTGTGSNNHTHTVSGTTSVTASGDGYTHNHTVTFQQTNVYYIIKT